MLDTYTFTNNEMKDSVKNIFVSVLYYIVPMRKYDYKYSGTIYFQIIVPATTPERAMYLAKQEFEKDGWNINENYENYKIYNQ